jgi:riboflavin synthase
MRTFSVPRELMPLLAVKGSVAIDGISLTIAACGAGEVTVALVPYTLEKTTLMGKRPGDRINIECDVLARYVVHAARYGAGNQAEEPLDRRLERLGF